MLDSQMGYEVMKDEQKRIMHEVEAYRQPKLEDLSEHRVEQKVHARKSIREKALCCVGQWLANWGRNMINTGNRAHLVQLKGL